MKRVQTVSVLTQNLTLSSGPREFIIAMHLAFRASVHDQVFKCESSNQVDHAKLLLDKLFDVGTKGICKEYTIP